MSYRARVSLKTADGTGLHARPALDLVSSISGLDCTVTLSDRIRVDMVDGTPVTIKDDFEADASRIMDVMMMAMADGTSFTVTCEGTQAEEAFRNLQELFGGETGYFTGSTFEILECDDGGSES